MIILLSLLIGVSAGAATYLAFFRKPVKTLYGGLGPAEGDLLYRRYSHGWFQAWSDKFLRSGGELQNSWVPGTVMIVVPLLLGIAAAVVSGMILAMPIIAAMAVALPWLFLRGQGSKRAEAMDAQLITFLDTVSKGIEGGTITQAIREAAERVDPPLSHELKLMLNEVDAGRPLPEALRDLASRTSSRGLAVTCSTLDLAISTGAPTLTTNLAEITSIIVAMQGLERQVKARTIITMWTGRLTVGILALFTAGSLLVATEAWLTPWGIPTLVFLIGIIWLIRWMFSRLNQGIMEVSP